MNVAYTSLDYNPENGRLAGGVDGFQKNDKYLSAALSQLLNRYEQSAGSDVAPVSRFISHFSLPVSLS